MAPTGLRQLGVTDPTLPFELDELSAVHMVTELVERGLRDRASDIHLEPLVDDVRIRLRIDGTLLEVGRLSHDQHVGLVSRLKILAGMNIVERRRPQDGQFSVDGRCVDVRLATVSTVFGEKVVLRLLDKNQRTKGLGELGMPPDTYRTFRSLVHSPFGMVMCAGPTGAGKTTTLYASLLELDADHRNITTIEDPVEYVFSGINQIKTNEQTGLTFASGLRALLRQDPDVILVGEIRDADTARLAVQAAHTGHLVLSSIHATDASAALFRFVEMGIETFLVASAVMGVVGQRLLRCVCTECRQPHRCTPAERAFLTELGAAEICDLEVTAKGRGCDACGGSGYHGRIGVYEVLRVTAGVRNLLLRHGTVEDIRATAISEGMQPLARAAVDLVRRGITGVDDVIRTLCHS